MQLNTVDHFRFIHALKIAIACMVTVITTIVLQLQLGMFAVMTTFVLMTIFSEEIAPMAVERFLGPALGFIIALFFIALFYDLHIFYLALLFVFLTAFMYLFAIKITPYAALMGGVTFAFVMFTAIQSPSNALELGKDWVFDIVVGGLVAWVFAHYFISNSTSKKKIITEISLPSWGVFLKKLPPIFPLQVDALKQALKIAIAIFFVLWTSVYLSWPGGMQAMIACAVILAQPNLGRSYQRAYLRALGVFAGGIAGALGIVILAGFPYFLTLVILLFIGLGVAAYVALGSQRYAYAGVMAGVMLPMTIFATNGPVGTLSIALERFAGVFIGAVVGMTVLYLIWPVFPQQQIKEKLASILRDCATLYRCIIQSTERVNKIGLEQLQQKISHQLHEKVELLNDAKYVFYGEKIHEQIFLEIATKIETILIKMQAMMQAVDRENLELIEQLLPQLSGFDVFFMRIANALTLPASRVASFDINGIIEKLNGLIKQVRDQDKTKRYAGDEIESCIVLVTAIKEILLELRAVKRLLTPVLAQHAPSTITT